MSVCRFTWFKFRPADFVDLLSMPDPEAGRRFKELVTRLLKNEAPEGTVERSMIDEARGYSESRRRGASSRWNDVERPRKGETPDMADVYEFAQAQGITDMVARNWYEWQDKGPGFAKLDNWKGALLRFSQLKVSESA